jgi:hypothetical protein
MSPARGHGITSIRGLEVLLGILWTSRASTLLYYSWGKQCIRLDVVARFGPSINTKIRALLPQVPRRKSHRCEDDRNLNLPQAVALTNTVEDCVPQWLRAFSMH